MHYVYDGQDWQKLATRKDNRMLFIDSSGYFIESIHDLCKLNLSEQAYIKLDRAAEIRQLSMNLGDLFECLSENANEEDTKLIREAVIPLAINLWNNNKLSYCTPL